MITIAIAEDNGFLIQAIREKLDFAEDITIAWTASDGAEFAEALARDPHLDLVLMDIEMPRVDGIEATRALKAKHPHIKVVMLTAFDNDDLIFRAIQAGADGYLLKQVNARDLAAGIRETLTGGAAMTPSIAMKTLRLLRNPTVESSEPEDDVKLTPREVEVLEQLSRGLTYKAAALNLFISESTVRKHVEKLYGKLQVHNKLQAVEEGRRRRLL